MIASADLSEQVARFSAKPIQMKAFSTSGFSVAAKYDRISDSWKDGGVYTTTKPSERLRALIEPFRVVPGRWRELVLESAG